MGVFPYLSDIARYLLSALIGFCLGGVLFSYHLPKLVKGVDVRRMSPDHNPGTVNAFKYAGIPVGIACLLCDLGKGFAPVFLAARFLDPARLWFALVIAAPVLGHAAAPLYRFKGGKAIAAAFGVFLGLLPNSFLVFLLAALYLFFSLLWVVNPHERRTVITFGLFFLLAFSVSFYTGRWSFCLGAGLVSATVIWKNLRDAQLAPSPEQPEVSKQNS